MRRYEAVANTGRAHSFPQFPRNKLNGFRRFSGRRSTDPDGQIVTYRWDFGDGTTQTTDGTTPVVTHRYTAVGVYFASLIVIDDWGNESTNSDQIRVEVLVVDAVLQSYYIATSGADTIRLVAQGATADQATSTSYAWDFGDGSPVQTTATPQIEHIYPRLDSFSASVVVTSNFPDRRTDSTRLEGTVQAMGPPTAAIELYLFPAPPKGAAPLGNTVRVGAPIRVGGATSDSPYGAIVRYEFDLDGDGVYETGGGSAPYAGHSFSVAGAHQVGLRVTDEKQNQAVTSLQVVVTP